MGLIECYPCFFSVLACFLLGVLYVGSLYIWGPGGNRNDPAVIKKRTISVVFVMIVSPVITKFFLVDDLLVSVPIWQVLGFRSDGIFEAAVIPLFLTNVLFLGPMCLQQWRNGWEPVNVVWLRNYVIAPLSEELTFRACMMPLLVQKACLRPMSAVFVCPLLFGLGHVHHMIERRREGMQWKQIMLITAFQFLYTTLFGAYSALLFIKTGHFIAPFLAHAYCNMMGFPDFGEVLESPNPRKSILAVIFVLGVVLWCVLLPSLTNYALYQNNLYMKISTR